MLRHGFHPPETQQRGSIQITHSVHPQGRTPLRCHIQAFAALGGVPIEILYDRMKTAVTGEDDGGHIVYNRSLLALAQHYRFQPRACRPYPAKTKGKVERPFSYIRQDFFLGRSFRNLDDLNAQLIGWLDTVANARVHGTTQCVVAEARERIRFLSRASLLVVDEIGYLPVTPGGGNLFFQLVNARYEKGAMILTSNRGFAE